MDIFPVFYAALGYLALVVATLSAMLFTGDGGGVSMMDAVRVQSLPHAVYIDAALLGLLALLHGIVSQRILQDSPGRILPRALGRATQAWLASVLIVAVICLWRPVPQVLWKVSGPPAVLLSIGFYLGWTLALIGAFLTYHLDLFALT
jgi:hypothetical protein